MSLSLATKFFLASLLVLSGCAYHSGLVSDREFSTFKTRSEAVSRLGEPDRDFNMSATWEYRVTGPGGRFWQKAILHYDASGKKIATHAYTQDD